jgi:hypothetical protein
MPFPCFLKPNFGCTQAISATACHYYMFTLLCLYTGYLLMPLQLCSAIFCSCSCAVLSSAPATMQCYLLLLQLCGAIFCSCNCAGVLSSAPATVQCYLLLLQLCRRAIFCSCSCAVLSSAPAAVQCYLLLLQLCSFAPRRLRSPLSALVFLSTSFYLLLL